jgi:hypothetical protein
VAVTPLDRLVAIEAIKQLKARYYRFLDSRDWDAFQTVFTDDAVMDMRDPNRILADEDGLYRTPRVIRAFAEKAIGAGLTIDHAILPEIDILSETTASGIWAQEDRVRWPEGHPNRTLHGFGWEHETYERVDGDWKIKSTRLVRLHVEIERATKAG